jgi:hypothetical protein
MAKSSDTERRPLNVLITGLPRSGTSLATAIIDGLESALALSEPQEPLRIADKSDSPSEFAAELARFYDETRSSVLSNSAVTDLRDRNGQPVTDYLLRREGQIRNTSARQQLVRPGLPRNFLLATKNNALYTSALPELVKTRAVEIIAIIRNPIDLITSWANVPFPITRGALPEGEKYWPELGAIGNSRLSVVQKQAAIIQLFFARYEDSAPNIKVIRYEDLTRDGELVAKFLERTSVRSVKIRLRKKRPLTRAAESRVLAVLRELAPAALKAYGYER